MATRLYLRNLTATNPPSAGEKSTVLPNLTLGADNATGTEETRALRTTKGAAQTSITQNSDAVTASRSNYLCRFTSEALGSQDMPTDWALVVAVNESNTNANSRMPTSLYVWRPSSSSVVGFIFDVNGLGTPGGDPEWAAVETGFGHATYLTGNAITAQGGDVLILEIWRNAAQAATMAYAQIVYFEGATDTANGTATSDAASWLESSTNLAFAVPNRLPKRRAPIRSWPPQASSWARGLGGLIVPAWTQARKVA